MKRQSKILNIIATLLNILGGANVRIYCVYIVFILFSINKLLGTVVYVTMKRLALFKCFHSASIQHSRQSNDSAM